ncbi:ribonuclease HII, partial [bacterium]|nr:ribonuclease HII [bacterium]
PVVAACVSCNSNFQIIKELKIVQDSKKLTPKKREFLTEFIKDNFNEIGIGICDHETIDRINILQASFLAMKKAISSLKQKPNFILVDGNFIIPNSSYEQKAIKGGDGKIFSIAAASIIAKVARDKIMEEMHKKYPKYGFDRHKGYGTKYHLEQIKKHGICDIHRKSFGPCKI